MNCHTFITLPCFDAKNAPGTAKECWISVDAIFMFGVDLETNHTVVMLREVADVFTTLTPDELHEKIRTAVVPPDLDEIRQALVEIRERVGG